MAVAAERWSARAILARRKAARQRDISPSVLELGLLFGFAADTVVAVWTSIARRRFAWRETLVQLQFLAAVCSIPAVLVMLPLGVVVGVVVASLAAQVGAEIYSGAVVGLVIVGQIAPLVAALMIAGAGGSAMTADLGARKIRDETDAMEVMGVSVLERLVVPRLVAAVIVTMLLTSLVMALGIGASFAFQVAVMDVSPGAFLDTMTDFAGLPDFIAAQVKAIAFAVSTAIVCCAKGLTAKGGPGGVGTAVNEAVVLAFILVFFANVGIGEVYALITPEGGGL
ncbi:phospholipid/cholesterol/gamma-HCH transport system permease protein [Haloechinothrix alba]|uniref:Phospholipid/cholesterol/gamma-HCH transport system permease protein n=3 Tax=Haloechinothrix TaxID=1425377 RepID=A0A238WNU4_9PSEU|nr:MULTISPECIES: ABC transporter permease [Haloechinothrix]MBA0127332.1 ABC transporter permease [Haloechinothrix aidingensis]SNR48195.1 phospholipid/cholesterol/gamma-HCH transport system permease protein [Haloechinothrix alba]